MTSSDDCRLILQLSLIEGIGAATIHRCMVTMTEARAAGAEIDWYHLRADEIDRLTQIGAARAIAIAEGLRNARLVDRELSLLQAHQIRLLTFIDEGYPALLRAIHVPPPILYVRACKDFSLVETERMIAIVGSRDATEYGRASIDRLVPPLVLQGWTIISGGAYGIDTAAHERALEAGGRTIAILGSGLLRPYPFANRHLFTRIVEAGGAIISPFGLEDSPARGNFPARNRIIAGLSRGTVVVQAARESGALITARYALEESREVFAVPGRIDDPSHQGCNALIAEGARLVADAFDIMEEFGVRRDQCVPMAPATVPCAVPVHPCDRAAAILRVAQWPCSFTDLQEHTHLNGLELQEVLFDLQIEGLLCKNDAGLWQKVE